MSADAGALETHLERQIEHSRDFFWHRLRWRAVRSLLPEGEEFELVDVGAGAGLVGEYLQRDRPRARYRFVEPLPSLASHLRSQFGADADANDLAEYPGARYLALLDVLEHQEDDAAFCRDLAAKMDPGAVLVLTVPALNRLWSGWDTALGHHRRYDKRSLRGAIEAAPLEVLELSYLFPELIPPALLRHRRRSEGEDSAEFPDLPPAANSMLYAIGSASLALRRVWPAGTSLMAVARRRG